jgi:hypothetical protein
MNLSQRFEHGHVDFAQIEFKYHSVANLKKMSTSFFEIV